jgi:hypothetical protein
MNKKPDAPKNLRVALSLAELHEISDAFDRVLLELDCAECKGTRAFAAGEAAQAKVKAAIASLAGK